MAKNQRNSIADLTDLAALVARSEGFADVLAALQSGQSAAIDGAWGSACALTAAVLSQQAPSTLVVVLPRIGDLDEFSADVAGFLGVDEVAVFPAWESLPGEQLISDSVYGGRLRILEALHNGTPPQLILTSIPALLQPVPDRESLQQGSREIRVGDEIDLDELMRWLLDHGCERVSAIEMPGEFSLHGGILDVYPPDAIDPLRIELFGDEIDSIRRFNVETQRKIEDLSVARVTFVEPDDGSGIIGSVSLLDSLPADSWITLVELQELLDEGRHFLERLPDRRGMFSVEATFEKCTDRPTITVAAIGADSVEASCHLKIESIERFHVSHDQIIAELGSVIGQQDRVLIACHNEGERERLEELFAAASFASQITFCIGELTRGFRLVRERLYVVGDHELFGRTEVRRQTRTRRRPESRAIDSFIDLNEGDLVVHLVNGIGRFRGMKLLEKDEQVEEHLEIEFRDNVRVYVPVSLIHLVQKYVGAAKITPELSKLGTTAWNRKKQKVAEAVNDMASDMIRLQAERESRSGIACPPDSHWMEEFEASFPYEPTRDQKSAFEDVKVDMQRARPMDRLICGDVGYGKTEVAMRAAFKCIDSGRQVAILVPTTVLAEQHYRSFSSRMAEYPVTIAGLSRFRTKREQKQILEAMAEGTVDLVIGTHRLVQKDVRFKNLGLLIIDEEQRFGVDAKEMLKRLRLEIDVLTLSATPIPRTLHMSLLGIRDISNLETPPRDRVAIETRVCRWDADLIRSAIVRELNRNGQVYFVHNRVYNIHEIADRLQQIVPEASIGIVHGQMSESELERGMVDFVSGQTDILVATTIIESGLDIPNANTMFIHQADIYGLADMHQLRGRVGRYHHRAYCYLIPSEDKPLTPTATKRLKAVEEYSELGAGFKIAMRDLEIRGAGNILGTEQSGHIATVGYELYCQLLENAVRRLQNLPVREHPHVAVDLPVSAFLPTSYIPPGRHKIELYRRLSVMAELSDLDEFIEELRDRYGPLPVEAERLMRVKRIQLCAWHWRIDQMHLEDGNVALRYRDSGRIRDLATIWSDRLRVVDHLYAYLILPPYVTDGDDICARIQEVLQPVSIGKSPRKRSR